MIKVIDINKATRHRIMEKVFPNGKVFISFLFSSKEKLDSVYS